MPESLRTDDPCRYPMMTDSAYARLRARLGRLLRGHGAASARPDVPLPDDPLSGSLLEHFGLVEDATPARERAGWRRPEVVLVAHDSPARLAWLRAAAPGVEFVPFTRVEEALPVAPRADALLGWHTPEMIERAQRLRWIQAMTAGVENAIAAPEIRARGILVTSLKRIAAPVIAEHVFALMLSASRRFRHFADLQRRRRWSQDAVDPGELGTLRGMTLLVVGTGGIGSAVARLARGFGMRCVGVHSRDGAQPAFDGELHAATELARLLPGADVVVNALPLTAETRGVFDAAMFDRFRTGAIFVNVGRGETVITDALVAALRSGRLGAVGLDVTDPEPLPRSHPLWAMPQATLTPHVAGVSAATSHWGWLVVRENLRRYAQGDRMLSVVDVARGY